MARPTYVPPERNSKRKRGILLLVVFFIVLASVLIYFLRPEDDEPPELVSNLPTICDYNTNQTKEKLNEINLMETQRFSDYFYYGETLSLFESDYEMGERDELMGSLLRLYNLCDDHVYSFLMTDTIDGNIPIEELTEGFYVASIEGGLNHPVLVSDEVLHDTFYTIRRDSTQNRVKLIADEDYFVDTNFDEKLFYENVLFIEVTTTSVDEIVDVVLDPAHMDQDFGPLDRGYVEGDYESAEKLYDLSLLIKEQLEAKGLKVALTRERDEIMNTYGQPSRLYKAYETQAKIMVEINMEPNSDGLSVTGSSYALLSLAESVAQELKNTSLPIFEYGNYSGAFYNRRLENLDYHNLIRESGGYSLGATKYSEISERLNQFAKDNRHGTQTIAIDYGDVSNPEFRNLLNEEFEQIAQATANGILSYLGLE